MTLPIWPSYALAPEPLNPSYAVKLPDTLNRTDFEQGTRQRRQFRSGPAKFSVTWPMSPVQYEIFQGYLETELDGGAALFQIPIFRGASYELMTAQFVKGSIDAKREGGEWLVSAQLEVPDYQAWDQTTTAAALLTYESGLPIFDLTDWLHGVIHYDYSQVGP